MAEPRQLEEMTHIRAEKPRNINKEYCYDWGIFCFLFYYINLTGNLLFSIATLRDPHFFYYGNILYRNDNDGIEIVILRAAI